MMTSENKKNIAKARLLLFMILLIIPAFPGVAEGLRNITSASFSYYFDDTCRLDLQDVLLIRIKPWLTLKTDIERIDTEDFYSLAFGLGPVINFTTNFYLDSLFGIGIDSSGVLSQKAEISLNQENDLSYISIGCRGNFYPETDYYYILPSISGIICPIEQLKLFCKLFFSLDKEYAITGSFWGDIAWSFTKMFATNAGFTISYADGIGYAVIGGIKFTINPDFNMKYQFKFLSNTIEYLDSPQIKYGIENGLIIDFRF